MAEKEKELTAQEIKAAIIKAKTSTPVQPVEQAEILGFTGWLFRVSSYEMAGVRNYQNNEDEDVRRFTMAKMVQISFRDRQGNPVFSDKDVTILAGLPDDVIFPVNAAAMRINGMTPKGMEDLVKNLIVILGVDGLYEQLANIGAVCPNCSKDTHPTS